MSKKRGLGKGIGALIPDFDEGTTDARTGMVEVNIDDIITILVDSKFLTLFLSSRSTKTLVYVATEELKPASTANRYVCIDIKIAQTPYNSIPKWLVIDLVISN